MDNWHVQLSTILENSLKPMEFAVFYNDNSNEDYQCLYANFDKYESQKEYDLYSIPSLIRVLTLKNQIISDEALENFYKDPATEAAFVLEWGPKNRKIIVFNTERPKVFDQEAFVQAINSEQDNMKKLFNRMIHT